MNDKTRILLLQFLRHSSFQQNIRKFTFGILQIDVAGSLQFWDVSIDTASSVLLILCFGLAVDYSAHVGHSFMTVIGTKNGTYITIN